jgi:selenocysteine lyase/cysteine desulfurase
MVSRARASFATLVGVAAGSVAMGGSVSALLALVAAAVPDGSRLVTLAGEFTSATYPFAAQAHRRVSISEVTPEELVATAGDYDGVVASVVQSRNGDVLDLEALRSAVDGSDALTVLDVTQAVGWKRLELDWADVAVAGVYKWLLAPRGTAWMSLSERMSTRLTPHAANWYAGQDPWETIYGLPLRLADDARRFDTSPAWFGALGAGLTMPWLAQLDAAAVEEHCVGLANRVCSELGLPERDSAIVSLALEDPAALEAAGIRASVRAGAVRVGFHVYNTEDDVRLFLDAVRG